MKPLLRQAHIWVYRQLKRTLVLRYLNKATAPYYGQHWHHNIDPAVFFKMLLTEIISTGL
jgi:hypothetical protein